MEFRSKKAGGVSIVVVRRIENTGDDDPAFVAMFASPKLLDVSPNRWIGHGSAISQNSSSRATQAS